MRITLYILRNFAQSFLRVGSFVLAVIFLIEFINNYSQIISKNLGAREALLLTLLQFPDSILDFTPLILLLSALFCFFRLSANSEIVVLRAAGLSPLRMVLIPTLLSGFIGILIITAFNPVIVDVRGKAKTYDDLLNGRTTSFAGLSSDEGNWLRSKSPDATYLIRLQRLDETHQNLAQDVTVYTFYTNGDIRESYAKSANLVDDTIILNDIFEVRYAEDISTNQIAQMSLDTDEDMASFFSDFYAPENIPNREMQGYIRNLEKDGYDIKQAEAYYYQQLSMPIFFACMCLIGSIFALAPPRMGGIARRSLWTLICGFSIYGFTVLTQSMGQAGTLPIWASVITIPGAALAVALAILLHEEDG